MFFFCFFLSESWEEIPAILLFEISESKGHVNLKVPRQQKIIEHLGSVHPWYLPCWTPSPKETVFLGTKILVLSAARKLTNTFSRPNDSGSVIEKSGAFLRINRNLYGNEALKHEITKRGRLPRSAPMNNFHIPKVAKIENTQQGSSETLWGLLFSPQDWLRTTATSSWNLALKIQSRRGSHHKHFLFKQFVFSFLVENLKMHGPLF